MKIQYFFFASVFALASCSGSSGSGEQTDSAQGETVLPDSVPQVVMVGKGGDWAYMPDSAINDIILGSVASMKSWTYNQGNVNISKSKLLCMPYINNQETEMLYIMSLQQPGNNKYLPYGFRLKRWDSTMTKDMHAVNYSLENNFITGHGIYIGMPIDFVQSIYKSQPMMKWVKNDTTFLAYAPSDKDSVHYTRYNHVDYSCLYKFRNDALFELEMTVDPESLGYKE